jgi:hypothetical protein
VSVSSLKIGNWKIERDHLYDMLSNEGKIALKAIEAGLLVKAAKDLDPSIKYVMIDDEDAIYYQPEPGHGMWLAKLARELEGEISLRTIDKYMDKLLDERILTPPIRSIDLFVHQVMERVVDDDGIEKWVRSYYVSNEHVADLLFLYKSTHRFSRV